MGSAEGEMPPLLLVITASASSIWRSGRDGGESGTGMKAVSLTMADRARRKEDGGDRDEGDDDENPSPSPSLLQ